MLSLLQAIGWLLTTVVACQLAWAILRPLLWWLMPTPRLARLVAGALSAALRDGRDAGDAMRGVAISLPLPWSRAAYRAGAALDAGSGVVETLTRERLVHGGTAVVGQAAERLGRVPLLRWLEELAAEPPGAQRLTAVLTPAVACLVMAALCIAFLSVFIAPKFAQICMDLAVTPHPNIALLAGLGRPWAVLLGIIGISGCCAWFWLLWSWRDLRRRSAGGLIVAATAQGIDEGGISKALGLAVTGDLPMLCAVCGWRAKDREGLLRAIAADAAWRERRAGLMCLVLRIAVPLLLAVPVWLIATGVFGTLISILASLEATT
jgi:hypothetical protein